MEITQARREDLPEMINLLRTSIGERLTPKTEEYFTWKHYENPFGTSKVILAKEDGKIVGLRAFMHWRWASAFEEIDAVRAVDTATDPAFQGKGIFKKLTLQAVDECTKEGVGLVFNSPNPISMAGYLKMGWYVNGRMPVCFGPGSLAPRLFREKVATRFYADFDISKTLQQLPAQWAIAPRDAVMHTPISTTYLQWRYANCPVAQYGAIIEKGKFGFIFRLKKINRFVELRVCEIWTEDPSGAKQARKALKKLSRKVRPALISCAPSPLFENDKKRLLGLFGPFKKGPITTLRPLAKNKLNNFDQFSQWQPSMGSMELF